MRDRRSFQAERAVLQGQLVQLARSSVAVRPALGGEPIGVALSSAKRGEEVKVALASMMEMDPHVAAQLQARMNEREFRNLRREKAEAAERARVNPEAELERLGAALAELDV